MNLIPTRYEILKETYGRIVYINETKESVNMNIIGKNFIPKFIKQAPGDFLEYCVRTVLKILEIQKYNKDKKSINKVYDIHVHLEKCGPSNMNIKIMKYLIKNLNETFEDVVNKIYVHGVHRIAKAAFYMIKPFLDKEQIPKFQLM